MLPSKGLISFLVLAVLQSHVTAVEISDEDKCSLPQDLIDEIASYRSVAEKIINATVNGQFKGRTYDELAYFVDRFGSRVSGSQNLEDAIDFMLDKLTKEELDNVHGEECQVPHWVRGRESATLVQPRVVDLPLLGLGGSVGTPACGVEAEVLVVSSFEELDNKTREDVEGKIVLYVPEWESYGVTVQYRSQGASKASAKGAVAALVRTIAPFSIASPHTGMQTYDDKVTPIPVAAISIESAHMLQRMQQRGDKIVVRLKMEAQTLPTVTSRNTVAELQGTKNPEKVILVSGHLDSWDVGQGAMDDGGGAFISWQALVVLKALGLKPKRTIRAVLWTAEEPGYVGAFAYREAHKNELDNLLFAFESDEGTFNPLGLVYKANFEGGCILQEVVKLLSSINATQLVQSDSVGSDIEVFQEIGVPGGSLMNANDRYFWFHHSEGDMLDVEDPGELDRSTALWAIVSYVIADISMDFPSNRTAPAASTS